MIVCDHINKDYPLGHHKKRVLRDISFNLAPGKKLGVLGRNGSGKSTLIKLIAGTEMPTSGKVTRHMTVSWPLGLGGGFQGSLTGYDNARFISRIYGRNYRDLADFIENFSELGRQLKEPVKTYSAGMQARLAFALSLAIEFDCYLIDEVIMVGDQNFQRKCHEEFFVKRADRAIILASHSPEIIREYCDGALVLDQGEAKIHGDIEEALEIYSAL
jgi:capsular polysaccharide transport system ATP-binding protein